MKRVLKKYFIPHEGNNHKPHLLTARGTLALVLLVLVVEGLFLLDTYVVLPSTGFLSLILPNVLVDETNSDRRGFNVAPVVANPLLEEAARLKAKDMADKGYFAHTSPEGFAPWHWLTEVGYDFSSAGENLAINFSDSKDVAGAWFDSPSHRANILNGQFTEVGIGTAEGIYQGRETTFIVEFFGRPLAFASSAQVSQIELPPQLSQAVPPAEMFIVVPPKPSNLEPVLEPEQEVASENMVIEPAVPKATVLEKISAAPRRAANIVYLLFGGIVFLTLLLAVFIKIEIQHPRLLLNGVLVILIIAGLFFFNQHIALYEARVF